MTAPVIIRPAGADDRLNLRAAIIELQDYERLLHPSRLPGAMIADAYLAWLQQQAAHDGMILVAECGAVFTGFVAGWAKHVDQLAETPPRMQSPRLHFDICILSAFRVRRIAERLLDGIELRLRRFGINGCLRIEIHPGVTLTRVVDACERPMASPEGC